MLSMVNVRVLLPPKETEPGAKLLENPGRVDTTVRVAMAVPLLPALEVRSPEVLTYVSGTLAGAITSTVIEHELLGPSSPSENEMVVPPSGAVSMAKVPQSVAAFAGAAITS